MVGYLQFDLAIFDSVFAIFVTWVSFKFSRALAEHFLIFLVLLTSWKGMMPSFTYPGVLLKLVLRAVE